MLDSDRADFGRTGLATKNSKEKTWQGLMRWCSSTSALIRARRPARDDQGAVKDLHAAGAAGTYDASVVTKDAAGKVHVNKDEMATRHGAWGRVAIGTVGGYLWRGMSRADVKEFGDLIHAGQAALLIVGESMLEQAVEKAGLTAEKHVAKELDVKPKDIGKAVQEAATQVS